MLDVCVDFFVAVLGVTAAEKLEGMAFFCFFLYNGSGAFGNDAFITCGEIFAIYQTYFGKSQANMGILLDIFQFSTGFGTCLLYTSRCV